MSDVSQAVRILRAGGLVAFPTETVYGVGADATNAAAVRKIFAAKGRPSTNPLIVHVADIAAAQRFAAFWPAAAEHLAVRFWPGPLTLVLPKVSAIVDEATAGHPTVALRSPDHEVALALLREFDGAVAAPSANRSTRISPTTADHVREELGDSVELIFDGGPCRVGIESTVLDLSGEHPTILRPGSVSRQQLEAEIGPVTVAAEIIDPSIAAKSPGMHAVHYAPRVAAFWFSPGTLDRVLECLDKRDVQIALVCMNQAKVDGRRIVWQAILPPDPVGYAHQLYATLRDADRSGAEVILIELPPDEPAWSAVRNRLFRASTPADY